MRILDRYAQWGFPQEDLPELPTVIRINTLRIDSDVLLERLRNKGVKLTKMPYLVHGYIWDAPFSASSTPEYLFGYYYIQEAASQLPVQVLDPHDGVVIDMCAAPGSKTTQISQWMSNKGMILALESSHMRLHALANNIERMGCENVVTIHKDARYVEDLDVLADMILLDAPCSGNLCIEKDWCKKRTLADFESSARAQRELFDAAWHTLKPGGRLLYSTCSLEIEEDEQVVEWALAEFTDASLVSIDIPVGSPGLTDATRGCRRLWPMQDGTQGFFMALFEKKGE